MLYTMPQKSSTWLLLLLNSLEVRTWREDVQIMLHLIIKLSSIVIIVISQDVIERLVRDYIFTLSLGVKEEDQVVEEDLEPILLLQWKLPHMALVLLHPLTEIIDLTEEEVENMCRVMSKLETPTMHPLLLPIQVTSLQY